VQRRAAFTLVEVLLVVGLLGLIAFVFVNSAADLFRTKEPRADDIFWQGVTAARQLALESNQTVTMRYDQEKHTLAWTAGTVAGQTLTFPGKLLEFLPVAQQGTVLIGGQLAETDSIKFVRFYPDGCCDGFRAQLTDAADRRTILAIDPWTCAPMLAALPK
jgi:Tfp pilus assembly protein FimT